MHLRRPTQLRAEASAQNRQAQGDDRLRQVGMRRVCGAFIPFMGFASSAEARCLIVTVAGEQTDARRSRGPSADSHRV